MIFTKIDCLDHGYVKLLNLSGPVRRLYKEEDIIDTDRLAECVDINKLIAFDADDTDPAKVARISFDNFEEDRLREADLQLNDYLLRNKHCYRGDMQVLTVEGWKRWDSLEETETFLVPDPITKNYAKETLTVVSFEVDEELYCYTNNRMAYSVTKEHTMWFKGKYQTHYSKAKVDNISKWGWFEPSCMYSLPNSQDISVEMRFIGFYLGDGFSASKNTIAFHLVKERKKKYLRNLLQLLDIPYSICKSDKPLGEVFRIAIPSWMYNYVPDITARAANKSFDMSLVSTLTVAQVKGLFDGLVNSDGSIKLDRPQIEFSSTSANLAKLFEITGTQLGYDVHTVSGGDGMISKKAYRSDSRTSLESRKEYHFKEPYNGKVYCTTTSTGLLAVRGSDTTFGFICGNSSPFEMIETWWVLKVPMFLGEQIIRHRTASINKVSGRYSTFDAEWYIPEVVGGKPANGMKQGQEDNLESGTKIAFQRELQEQCRTSYQAYKAYLERGVAPEHARLFLHANHYSTMVWKMDLHNLMHFLSLRLDSHAQVEARVYANAIYDLLSIYLPETIKLFDKYKRLS